ncbi:MAG: hypothetical protein Q4D21_00305 [Phascolarctobacterium sp.]|nr:hypothetical protein [Phascolarctobacterium sp.]
MNKYAKYLLIGGMITAFAFAAGCGGDDKKKEEPKKPATTNTQKQTDTKKTTTNNTAKPAGKLASGPNWVYPAYIKNASETPKMTPEIQKIVDDCYKQMKLHPSANGKLLNDSKISPSDQRKVRDLWFHARGANYNRDIKFKDTKGKDRCQEEMFHIRFIVDKDTSAIKSYKFTKYERNKTVPDGKETVFANKKF